MGPFCRGKIREAVGPELTPPRPRCILVFRLGSLGDTVIALPAFHAIRRAYPDARIVLLTNKPVKAKAAPIESILGPGYFFDEVIRYPVGTRNPITLLAILRQIRHQRVDIAINLTSHRSASGLVAIRLLFAAAGIRTLVSFDASPNTTDSVTIISDGRVEWEAERIARRVMPIAVVDVDDDASWDLRLTPQERQEADRLLQDLTPREMTICASVGTKMQAKDWGIERWADLFARLAKIVPTANLVLLGAAEERSLSEAACRDWTGKVANLAGRADVRVGAAALEQCQLFVGHDSGPMHVAAAVGVPCVAIFSARDAAGKWIPRGRENILLRRDVDCAGCMLETCIQQKRKCLTQITVDEVLEAIELKLSSIGPREN